MIDAVALIRRELRGRVPLIGFAGSPWTVGTYMVEGGGSKTFGHIKRMMYEAPLDLHRLLGVLAKATILTSMRRSPPAHRRSCCSIPGAEC